jgi:redox-sensitive bicupin YhaK (pirin superfamily)
LFGPTGKEVAMLTVRHSNERGYADHGWLQSRHSFSFADYFDPAHMGFGNLRVINEDCIAPGSGFGTHGHRDMEIISVVLKGALGHQDSMGHVADILPGEVQRMSAGTGVRHSEMNHATDQETHFFQIWIEPDRRGHSPSYEQKVLDPAASNGQLDLIASPIGHAGASGVSIHADAHLYLGRFEGEQSARLPLAPGRLAYVHLMDGSLEVNGVRLNGGDAALLRDEAIVHLEHASMAQVMVFDLASA